MWLTLVVMPRGAKKIDGPKSEVPGVAWDKNANKWKVRLSKGFILNPIVLTLSPSGCAKASESKKESTSAILIHSWRLKIRCTKP